MPLPNEHSARVRNPEDFDSDSFRRKKLPGSDVVIIVGKLKGKAGKDDPVITQAYRFPKDKFTEAEAKKWLKDNDVEFTLFEPASEETEAEGGKPKASLTRLAVGPRIALDADELAEVDKPKWQHVATEGEYKGYNYGEMPFKFESQTFDEMIRNFRADPAYKAGPDGVGTEPVLPWDFHHATDSHPADTAVDGAPAQGWVLELERKTGDDGKAQLWALTNWLDTAREYIQKGQYKWASVSALLNAVDQHTGKRVGAKLLSIAMTNTPFIQGLNQLAASQQTVGKVAARGWYEAADTALDAVGSMKDLFGLPGTAGVAEVVGEIAKMQQWVAAGIIPLGVDLDDIVGALRKILNLKALLPVAEVLSQASTITGALLADQTLEPEQGTAAPELPAITEGENDMTLLKTLADALSVREGDAEVIAEVKDSVKLRATLKDKLGADKDSTRILIEAVDGAVEAKVNLGALYESLEATKQSDAVDAVVVLLDKAKKWDEAEPEIVELRKKVEDEEKAKAEADVDKAMKAHKIPEQVRPALLLERTTDPDAFAKRFPPLTEQQTALTQKQVTGGESQLQDGAENSEGEIIDLTSYPGRNPCNRMKKYVRGTVQGADKWTDDEIWEEACRRLDNCTVVGLD